MSLNHNLRLLIAQKAHMLWVKKHNKRMEKRLHWVQPVRYTLFHFMTAFTYAVRFHHENYVMQGHEGYADSLAQLTDRGSSFFQIKHIEEIREINHADIPPSHREARFRMIDMHDMQKSLQERLWPVHIGWSERHWDVIEAICFEIRYNELNNQNKE